MVFALLEPPLATVQCTVWLILHAVAHPQATQVLICWGQVQTTACANFPGSSGLQIYPQCSGGSCSNEQHAVPSPCGFVGHCSAHTCRAEGELGAGRAEPSGDVMTFQAGPWENMGHLVHMAGHIYIR